MVQQPDRRSASPSSARTTRSAPPARPRSTTSSRTLLHAGDQMQLFKYIVKNTAWHAGKTATFMPKPLFGDNGSGMHTHQSLWLGGEPLFYDETGYAGLSDIARWYIGGLLHHAPSLLAFTNPTVNSYRRLVPGFEAPVNLVYSQRNRSACTRIPVTGTQRRRPSASSSACRTRRRNPYLAFSAMLMAGLDGIKNKIEPPAPIDKDLYDLPPEEVASVTQVPGSLPEVLDVARGRPRLPARGWRLHPGPDRDLDRLQARQRDRPGPPAPDPARVRDVLRLLIHLLYLSRPVPAQRWRAGFRCGWPLCCHGYRSATQLTDQLGSAGRGTIAVPVAIGVVAGGRQRDGHLQAAAGLGSATALTVPPCASQTARTIDRPSPEPRDAGALPAAPPERLEQPRHVGRLDLEAGVADDQPGLRRRRRCAPRAGRAGGCSGPRSRSGCRPAGRAGSGSPTTGAGSQVGRRRPGSSRSASALHRGQRGRDAGRPGRPAPCGPAAGRPAPRCGPAPAARRPARWPARRRRAPPWPSGGTRRRRPRGRPASRRSRCASRPAGCAARARRWRRTASAPRTPRPSRSSIASKVRGQLGHLVVGAGVADPLVEGLAAEPPRGRGDLLQRAQRPAGHRVRAGDADHADREQREQALDQQLPRRASTSWPATRRVDRVPSASTTGAGRSSSAGCSASPTSSQASSTRTAPAPTSRMPLSRVSRSRRSGAAGGARPAVAVRSSARSPAGSGTR